MIIQCQSCSRKFIVKDSDITNKGRTVQCGYCSVTWHQMPILRTNKFEKKENIKKTTKKPNEDLSVDSIKASDGKTYKFLGSQWAQLLPSGKTGLFAKRKIGKELDKLKGRKIEKISEKKAKKVKKELNPSVDSIGSDKKLPDVYRPKQGIGFFGYIFLIIIIGFSVVGILKTFENDLITYYPETTLVFETLNQQLEYLSESFKNLIVIIGDLINTY